MSDKSKICAIGEKKLIGGKWYEKASESSPCRGCAFSGSKCVHPNQECVDSHVSIEEGGTECVRTIWIACDPPKPETPAVEECAGCRFWKKDRVNNDGVCRRYPIDQPKKYRADWCGEWKA